MNFSNNKSLLAELNETKDMRDYKEHIFKDKLSKKLSLLIDNNNISPKELSELTGYTQQHCYNLKRNVSSNKLPSLFFLYRLSRTLNISPEYFFNLDYTLNSPTEDELTELKKETLINKIKNIDNDVILDKLLNDINFMSELSKENSEFKY